MSGKKIGCVIALIATPPVIALRGVVARDLWNWFVAPLGAPHIGILGALGIATLVAYLTYQPVVDPLKDEEHGGVLRIALSAIISLVMWGLGWLFAVGLA